MNCCGGDIRMFVENAPIRELEKLNFDDIDDVEIVMAMTENYPALTNIDICVKSSDSILKIVEFYRDLESLSFDGDGFELGRSDIEAIASLPRLKFLDLGFCKMTNEAISALSGCRKLKKLRLLWNDGLNDVFRVINRGGSFYLGSVVFNCRDVVGGC
jgi:hypothetical protein